jgi:anti-anti-sigma regulatory factor
MQTTIDRAPGDDGTAILGLDGELDASNFQSVIDTASGLYADGARRLVVDLSSLSYMSSSGLVCLHALALLFRGLPPPDPDAGWDAIHSIGLDADAGERVAEVKLVSPQPNVARVLDRTGLGRYFEVHQDRASAIASF